MKDPLALMSIWYFVRNNRREGPVSAAFVADEYRMGRLNDDDTAWTDTLDGWARIGDLPEILALTRAVPPPIPPEVPAAPLPERPTATTSASVPVYATIPQRFFAYVVDQLVLVVPFFFLVLTSLGIASAYIEGFNMSEPADLEKAKPYMLAFGNVVTWLYYVGFQTSRLQATPGMIVFGLRLGSTEGQRLSFLRGTVRHLLCSLTLPVTWIPALFTPTRQMLHDAITNAVVTAGHPRP